MNLTLGLLDSVTIPASWRFPLTMISKRVERGEKVDVFELFNGVAAEVEAVRKRGG